MAPKRAAGKRMQSVKSCSKDDDAHALSGGMHRLRKGRGGVSRFLGRQPTIRNNHKGVLIIDSGSISPSIANVNGYSMR